MPADLSWGEGGLKAKAEFTMMKPQGRVLSHLLVSPLFPLSSYFQRLPNLCLILMLCSSVSCTWKAFVNIGPLFGKAHTQYSATAFGELMDLG